MTTTDKIEPIHPGEILMEDFIEGFGITQNKLAVSIGVPPRRINEIVHGKRGITADTALRLAKYFGTSAEFWLNLQTHYDLDRAEDRSLDQIDARGRDQQAGVPHHHEGAEGQHPHPQAAPPRDHRRHQQAADDAGAGEQSLQGARRRGGERPASR